MLVLIRPIKANLYFKATAWPKGRGRGKGERGGETRQGEGRDEGGGRGCTNNI